MMSATAILRPQVENGRVKLIALQNRKRSILTPGIPTVAEAGFPDLTFDGVVGSFGSRDMPKELREKIAADVRTVAEDPVIKARMGTSGQALVPGSGADMIASMEDQRARAATVAKILGLKPARQRFFLQCRWSHISDASHRCLLSFLSCGNFPPDVRDDGWHHQCRQAHAECSRHFRPRRALAHDGRFCRLH